MPANLTPDYHRAEERFRQSKTVEEKIDALEQMLRIVPKHKGTDGLQGHALTQLEILGLINVTHAASGDELHNSEAAGENTPLREARRCGNAGRCGGRTCVDTRQCLRRGNRLQVRDHAPRPAG